MNRSEFLGLLTLPFLTKFVKKEPVEVRENFDYEHYPTTGSGSNGEVVQGDSYLKSFRDTYKILERDGETSIVKFVWNEDKTRVIAEKVL